MMPHKLPGLAYVRHAPSTVPLCAYSFIRVILRRSPSPSVVPMHTLPPRLVAAGSCFSASGPYDTGFAKDESFNETSFALSTGDVRSVRVSRETYNFAFNIQLG